MNEVRGSVHRRRNGTGRGSRRFSAAEVEKAVENGPAGRAGVRRFGARQRSALFLVQRVQRRQTKGLLAPVTGEKGFAEVGAGPISAALPGLAPKQPVNSL